MTDRAAFLPLVSLLVIGSSAFSQQTPATDALPGEQLYSTHCIYCHTSQVHWRDKKIAKDWASLVTQVRRWQSNAGLGWTEDEILEVAQYLNHRYYHFTEKERRASLSAVER
jgi:mono/diheme cytochrome c family protein